MKKNIRIAAALCAAVFALPVLAGCDFINGDKSENGNTNGVGSNGGTGKNPFVGKTLVYEDTEHRDNDDGSWVEDYDYISMTFTTDTAGTYLKKSQWTSSSHEYDEEETEEFPFTYSLGSANGKNFLRVLLGVLNDEETERFLQEYPGVSEKTKGLLVERELTEFFYYEFGENNTVKINDRYYAGDISKSRETFENNYDETAEEYVEIYFRRKYVHLVLYKKVFDEYGGRFYREKVYWGIPEFNDNGKDFTVEMYFVEGHEDECTYTPIGTLKGNCDIPGMTTTSKCTGTVSFTEFPNEMKGVFATSYSVQNWDARHDAEEHNDWVEYTIVTN